MKPNVSEAIIVAAGEGRTVWVAGRPVTIKVPGESTGGAFSVFESAVPPNLNVPTHAHRNLDETFYILDGTFDFLLGEDLQRVTAGATIHVPRGVCHCFKNVGSTWGRILSVSTPAGMEKLFEDIAVHKLSDGDDPEERRMFLTLIARHDLEMEPPADGPLTA